MRKKGMKLEEGRGGRKLFSRSPEKVIAAIGRNFSLKDGDLS
jgi:hypothetical protein